ncbi:MAG: sensor domain-containing diguanylate cyclase [Chloroflexota bacterium]
MTEEPFSPLQILEEARRSLAQSSASLADQEELLKLLDLLILATRNYAEPEKMVDESRLLTSSLVSSQALLMLLKQQMAELDALRKLSLSLTSSLDLQSVLAAVVSEAMHLVRNTRAVHIFLYKDGMLEFGAALDYDGRTTAISTPRENGLTYAVARSGELMIVEDIQTHPLYKDAPSDWEGSIIGIPLKMGDRVVGVMNLSRSNTGGFSASETRLLGLLADQAAVAVSNASLHQKVSAQALSDTVTGLPNRRALDERLESEVKSARRTGFPFAVVMMDLDGFKDVNDTYGHSVGDDVLRVLFNYLAQGLRTSDFLARYGGDELTLVMNQTDMSRALVVCDKILEKLTKFHFPAPDGNRIRIGLSGGVAIYPVHGITGPELLRAADAALYRAKRRDRGKFLPATGPTAPLQ